MPNGVYPVPRFRAASEPTRRSLGRRVSVWLHRVELDEQLAAGAQPSAGSLLQDRTEQLSSVRARARLASSLAETLSEARRPAPIHGARLPLRRREIRNCDEDIIALIRRLEDESAIDAQGAAMVTLLLTDGASPLYRAGDRSLRFAIRSARLALDPVEVSEPSLVDAA
jgi:hypothetical protein